MTDVVLIRMTAYEHLLGPYKPTAPFVLSVWGRVWRFIRRKA